MAFQTSSSSQARPINYAALGETALLGFTAALLVIKWLRGQLDLYVHPRYTLLVVISALVLLMMAWVRGRAIFSSARGSASGGLYLLLAVPLLLGAFVPAQPLGADTLNARGVGIAAAPKTSAKGLPQGDSTRWNLLEWTTALSVQGAEDIQGKPVDVIGFVFHDAKLGSDRFYAVRYVITCCAADGSGVGLPVLWSGGEALTSDSWVRVRGTVGTTSVGGVEQPAIVASVVEPVAQPDNPYLYP